MLYTAVTKRITSALLAMVLAMVCTTAHGGEGILFSDDFSSGALDPAWVVDYGNVSVVNGAMNFAGGVASRVRLDVPGVATGTPLTLVFRLRQTNQTGSSYTFRLEMLDTVVGQSYFQNASPNVNYYGGGAVRSGFHGFNSAGQIIVGAADMHLNTNAAWQELRVVFHPDDGVKIYKDGTLATQWANFRNLTRVDRIAFVNNTAGGVSLNWQVDDVIITSAGQGGPAYCGDEHTVFPPGDLTGPEGHPDCYVDFHDLSLLAAAWLRCTDPADPACDQSGHTTTTRNQDAIQTIFREGVPHTDRRGRMRMTYDPAESFFSIGTWGTPLPGTVYGHNYDWNELVDLGVNTVWPWNRPAAPSLQAGDDFDMQIIIMGDIDADTLLAIKDHPRLLGNVWRDEPPVHGSEAQPMIDAFVDYKAAVANIAPELPVFVNLVPWITPPARDYWITWTQIGDIAGHDNYPVFPVTDTIGYNPNGIPQVCLLAAEVTDEQKPIWLIVGNFMQQGPPDQGFPFRMPTVDQVRAQVYAGLIHGATGIHYFIWDSYISRDGRVVGMSPDPQPTRWTTPLPAHHEPATPMQMTRSLAMWLATKQVNAELATLTPALLSPTAGPEVGYAVELTGVGVSYTPVRCLLKEDPAGGYVLLTVNVDDAVIKATYTFDAALAAVAPLFENRPALSLASGAHSFTQDYEPFATHVFHITLAP